MVLVLAVALGVAIGIVTGGRLGRLADLPLRAPWLFGVAIAIQVAAYPPQAVPWTMPDALSTAMWIGSYALLTTGAALNRQITGFPIVTAGLACNLIAVVANGGHMPALPSALRDAGVSIGHVHLNSVYDAHPALPWLVDRWGAPGWVPLANVYSIGDVLLGVGAVVIVVAAMRRTPDPAPIESVTA